MIACVGIISIQTFRFRFLYESVCGKAFQSYEHINQITTPSLTQPSVCSLIRSFTRIHSNTFQWAIIHYNRIPHHSMNYIVFPDVNSDLPKVSICVQIKRKFWWKAENQTIYWFQGNNFEIIFTLITIIPTITNRVRTCNGRRCSLFAKHNVPYVHTVCVYEHITTTILPVLPTIMGSLFGQVGFIWFPRVNTVICPTRWEMEHYVNFHSLFRLSFADNYRDNCWDDVEGAKIIIKDRKLTCSIYNCYETFIQDLCMYTRITTKSQSLSETHFYT